MKQIWTIQLIIYYWGTQTYSQLVLTLVYKWLIVGAVLGYAQKFLYYQQSLMVKVPPLPLDRLLCLNHFLAMWPWASQSPLCTSVLWCSDRSNNNAYLKELLGRLCNLLYKIELWEGAGKYWALNKCQCYYCHYYHHY